MPKALVIVESPAKARTIEKFLGRGYQVKASMGHVRDLPKSQMGIDVEKDFTPKYITVRGKGEIVAGLREQVRRADKILLATDPDREGEAISWHLANLLGLECQQPLRITFQEITKDAVRSALARPRPIDMQLVDAQQARRVLDRLVGYQLSPLLWRKVRGGLSAGRVQSVAVRLIVDREAEITAFRPEEYWTLIAALAQNGQAFTARYWGRSGKRFELHTADQAQSVLADLGWPAKGRKGGVSLVVKSVRKQERRRNPSPPFTTATLQQEAARKLGFTARRTMRIAQELYEGLSVDGEHMGLITYMRTDSVRVADQAVAEAAEYVSGRWGNTFSVPRRGSARAGAQDAHEAVRPTAALRTPESLKADIGRDQLRLYRLIWERFVASQMAPAVLDTVRVDLEGAGAHIFRATGSSIKFPGFMVLYVEGKDEAEGGRSARNQAAAEPEEDDSERILPPLEEGDRPDVTGLEPAQHFTEPPPRYTEAMLVKVLEEKGIGRPSTYAAIIETIESRGYVDKERGRFRPTDIGVLVTDLLKQYFPNVVDVAFTAQLEQQLDGIEEGQRHWKAVVGDFYSGFAQALEQADAAIPRMETPDEPTGEVCPNCGKPMVIKHGRFGRFLACTGYPECKTTKPILERTGVRCPRCEEGELVVRRSKKGRAFYGCERYPACDYVLWDRPVGACPVCNQPMVERGGKQGGRWLACVNEACGHRQGLGDDSQAGEAPPPPPEAARPPARRPRPGSTRRSSSPRGAKRAERS